MSEQVKPAKKFITGGGVEMIPLATLVDGDDNVLHLVVEDGCYVAYLYNEATGFVPTPYIFSELFALLGHLQDPTSETVHG
jgi:hypothetical protein